MICPDCGAPLITRNTDFTNLPAVVCLECGFELDEDEEEEEEDDED